MKEITINLAWLMKLLEAVIATLGRLLPPLPGMADRKSSRSESSGGDRSHRDDSSNNKTTYGSDEKDPFEILGLKRNTTIEEAKKAMRKLALTWHPDRNIDNTEEATKKMQEINDAYHRVKKILECGGDDGKDEEADQSESEDESVYESESARRNARKKKWKQQDDNEKEFARKVRKEFINFERAQRNAARGNYDYEPPSFKETTSKSSKSAKKNARQRRAKKRKVNKAAHCSHLDGSNRSNEIGTKAADVNNIPFHQLVPEKRCLIKFRSKDLLKTPTFTGEFLTVLL
jgi:curved DNA-binding protein CbpA